MKMFNRISIALLSLAAALGVSTSCVKEIVKEADAVMVSEQNMTFPAAAATQTLTVYADGDWVADVTEEWFNITPKSGTGTVDVTVETTENLGTEPREGYIVIKGSSIVSDLTVTVYQKMDRFRDTAPASIAEVTAMAEGDLAKVPGCRVVAMTTTGFVVAQDDNFIYVNGTDKTLKLGDMITVTGDVVKFNDINAIKLEDAFLSENGSVPEYEAQDITEETAYAPGAVKYVKFDGSYAAGKLAVNDKAFASVLNPVAELNMDQWERHKITLYGFYVGEASNVHVIVPVAVEDIALEGQILAQFEIETSAFADANKNTFPTTRSFSAIEGPGSITYVPFDIENTDPNQKYVMDISGNDPRCTGPWPGDYWLIVADTPVKAGAELQIKLGARTSATGHKYWILEYLDGKLWKTAGTELMSTDMPAGQNVAYTHAMNSDGSTNVAIKENVIITKNMDKMQFRFRCAANWQANGSGALAARNGGSARLAVKNAYQPVIILLKDGDGNATEDPEPIYATVETSAKLLTFEGMPAEPKVLKVKSTHDFTINTTAPWLHLSATEGVAGEQAEIEVKCDTTALSTLRQSVLTIKSEDTVVEIPVVQSAAGQDLDAFISVGANSAEVGYKSQSLTVKVQSTDAYEVSSDVDWISLTPFTKSMVNKTEETLYIAENESSVEDRIGHVTFAIPAKNVETVLTVKQGHKPAAPSNTIFEDDFEWMRSYIDYYNANSGKVVGKTIEDKNASANSPQIYDSNFVGLTDAFVKRGWSDLNAAGKMVYINDAYLKFSKTGGNNTAVAISLEQYLPTTMDLTVSFDYAMQIQGSGTVDEGPIVLKVLGDGTFENGTKYSDPITTAQKTGELFWNKAEGIRINGASGNTQIVFINGRVINGDSYNWSVAGAGRFFLDNVKIEKAKAAPQVIWSDNFDWLKDMIAEYNAANSNPIGNSVEGHTPAEYSVASGANAPNAYTAEPFKSKFPAALAAAGYTDLNAGAKVIYPQDTYLKFGKTSAHTSLQFAPFASQSGAADYEISFDWCRHVQGTATIDPVELVIVISGDGMFENGTKVSDPMETPQKYVVKDDAAGEPGWAEMFWTNSTVKIFGATPSTKINIVYKGCLKDDGTYNWTVSGAHRYHIDNIKVVK